MGNIIISPTGGLANKLRAIISTKILANYLGYSHFITNWIENDNKPGFNTIYQTGEVYNILPNPTNYTQLYPEATNYHFDLNKLRSLDSIFIESYSALQIIDVDHNKWLIDYFKGYQNLQLIDNIDSQIPKLPMNTIGLHIRRGDNEKSIDNSPIELFIKTIENNQNTPIFLSTDDATLEKDLIKKYDNIIINKKTSYICNQTVRPDIRTKEDSAQPKEILKQSLIEAVIDVYMLSKCNVVYGSYWSSFSELASYLNNTKLIILKK